MGFTIIYAALLLLFIFTLNLKFSKSLVLKSFFSPKNTHLVQLFLLLILCVIISLHMYLKSREGLESSGTTSDSTSGTTSDTTSGTTSDTTSGTTSDTTSGATSGTTSDTTSGSTSDTTSESTIKPKKTQAIKITESANKAYDQMSQKQLAEQLSVYGTKYTADSPLIQSLYKEMKENQKTQQPTLTKKELTLLGQDGQKNPQPSPIYYQPGTYMYDGTGYEPTYEEVMLTRDIPMQPVPINSAPYLQGGFCKYFEGNPMQVEKHCNQLDPEICASTDCCILLNGKKCVQGNEFGPRNKENYSDYLLGNVDYWYYKGKGYGNTP